MVFVILKVFFVLIVYMLLIGIKRILIFFIFLSLDVVSL